MAGLRGERQESSERIVPLQSGGTFSVQHTSPDQFWISLSQGYVGSGHAWELVTIDDLRAIHEAIAQEMEVDGG